MAALALAALGHKLALALRLRLGRAALGCALRLAALGPQHSCAALALGEPALGCALRLAALALSCARAALEAGQWLALGPSLRSSCA